VGCGKSSRRLDAAAAAHAGWLRSRCRNRSRFQTAARTHRTLALSTATAAWSEAFYAAVDEVNDHFGSMFAEKASPQKTYEGSLLGKNFRRAHTSSRIEGESAGVRQRILKVYAGLDVSCHALIIVALTNRLIEESALRFCCH
jgi:hypothetical protein